MYSRLSAEVRFSGPLLELDFEGLPTDHAFERRDLCLVVLKQISCLGIIVERSSFKLPHPESDQVARDVVSAGESMKRLACQEVLDDLPFELDAVGAIVGHGFHL